MGKEEYLVRVQSELGFMTSDRYNEACAYFESCFDGSQSDEEVMRELGTPKNAAKNYFAGYMRIKIAPKGIKRTDLPKGLIAAFVILLLPLLVPAAVGAVTAAFILAGTALSLIALIPAVTISMWFGGAAMFLRAFFAQLIFLDRLMQIGAGLALFGFGLLFTWLVARWYRHMIPAIIRGGVKAGNTILKKISPITGGEQNEE